MATLSAMVACCVTLGPASTRADMVIGPFGGSDEPCCQDMEFLCARTIVPDLAVLTETRYRETGRAVTDWRCSDFDTKTFEAGSPSNCCQRDGGSDSVLDRIVIEAWRSCPTCPGGVEHVPLPFAPKEVRFGHPGFGWGLSGPGACRTLFSVGPRPVTSDRERLAVDCGDQRWVSVGTVLPDDRVGHYAGEVAFSSDEWRRNCSVASDPRLSALLPALFLPRAECSARVNKPPLMTCTIDDGRTATPSRSRGERPAVVLVSIAGAALLVIAHRRRHRLLNAR